MSDVSELFRPEPEGVNDLYVAVGGMLGLEKLTEAFYARVGVDPLLRPMFRKNLKLSRERLTLFLAERFGGPKEYSRKGCPVNLLRSHAAVPIDHDEAHAWLDHMEAAIRESGLSEPLQTRLSRYFIEEAQGMETPFCHHKLAPLDDLERRLKADPSILSLRNALDQTLLGYAAGLWDGDRVRLLLSFGAKTNDEKTPPLYHAANRFVSFDERRSEAGGTVVRLLAEAGTDVNAVSGAGGQTPLHMAARRGNLAVAEALLAAGADIDPQDRKGETPLRRAVNCGQPELIALLLQRGADPHLADRSGRTPLQAAQATRKGSHLPLFKA